MKMASGLVLVMLFCGAGLFSVSAQENQLTEQQMKNIKANCSSMKNTLNRLHTSDTLLRVNSGQIYDSILNKLMNGFNSRIANNNFSNTDLTLVSDGYETALDIFRSDYITYEKRLSSAISIDCSEHPSSFYDAVMLARSAREKVHADVVLLNQDLDGYQAAVAKFESDYKTAVEGIKR